MDVHISPIRMPWDSPNVLLRRSSSVTPDRMLTREEKLKKRIKGDMRIWENYVVPDIPGLPNVPKFKGSLSDKFKGANKFERTVTTTRTPKVLPPPQVNGTKSTAPKYFTFDSEDERPVSDRATSPNPFEFTKSYIEKPTNQTLKTRSATKRRSPSVPPSDNGKRKRQKISNEEDEANEEFALGLGSKSKSRTTATSITKAAAAVFEPQSTVGPRKAPEDDEEREEEEAVVGFLLPSHSAIKSTTKRNNEEIFNDQRNTKKVLLSKKRKYLEQEDMENIVIGRGGEDDVSRGPKKGRKAEHRIEKNDQPNSVDKNDSKKKEIALIERDKAGAQQLDIESMTDKNTGRKKNKKEKTTAVEIEKSVELPKSGKKNFRSESKTSPRKGESKRLGEEPNLENKEEPLKKDAVKTSEGRKKNTKSTGKVKKKTVGSENEGQGQDRSSVITKVATRKAHQKRNVSLEPEQSDEGDEHEEARVTHVKIKGRDDASHDNKKDGNVGAPSKNKKGRKRKAAVEKITVEDEDRENQKLSKEKKKKSVIVRSGVKDDQPDLELPQGSPLSSCALEHHEVDRNGDDAPNVVKETLTKKTIHSLIANRLEEIFSWHASSCKKTVKEVIQTCLQTHVLPAISPVGNEKENLLKEEQKLEEEVMSLKRSIRDEDVEWMNSRVRYQQSRALHVYFEQLELRHLQSKGGDISAVLYRLRNL